uniref:Uncharacterized protein n=1 Tax=Roseihalotalea indica TaxID=2867963 RepID=A0AA49GKB8_9BACT|nr:hypothetical protein K4G66_29260 [Tunicatimonas sp. TK19036]
MKQNQQYETARVVVQVLQSDDDKQKALAKHGFDRKRTQDGQAILEKIDQLTDERHQQDGNKLQASQTLQVNRKNAHVLYMRHVRLARLVFGDSIEKQRPLKIDVPRQKSLAGWLEQAATFYRNAPAYIGELSKVGITIEELQQGDAMVQAVAQARIKQAHGTSAVQRLSKQRLTAFEELHAWLKDFRYIARYAFQDDPQQLEAFGMVVA